MEGSCCHLLTEQALGTVGRGPFAAAYQIWSNGSIDKKVKVQEWILVIGARPPPPPPPLPPSVSECIRVVQVYSSSSPHRRNGMAAVLLSCCLHFHVFTSLIALHVRHCHALGAQAGPASLWVWRFSATRSSGAWAPPCVR